ncbi:MAG: hypothetical protein ACOC5D_04655 [Thermoplasmatota archaeon]
MAETEKTLMAIEEKKKWAKREEEILEELERVKEKKKKLIKKANEIKDRIRSYQDKIRSRTDNRSDLSREYYNQMKKL